MAMIIVKDEIFHAKKKALKSTLSFLKAIKERLPESQAIQVADTAAASYMIETYAKVFEGTEPETQERFDRFRSFYESHPKTSPYCEIMESTTTTLKVKFSRCPHAEILSSENLFEFANSSCLSDIALTKELLPGVTFTRESSFVNGNKDCVMEWKKST
jgi:hypothetical protein